MKRKIIQNKLAIAREVVKADQRALEPVLKLLDDLDREVSKIKSTLFGELKDHLSFSGGVVMLIKKPRGFGQRRKSWCKGCCDSCW